MKEWIFRKFNISTNEEFKQLIIQFIKFGLVGVSNTAVSLACYYIVLWINPKLYILGSVLGAVLSIANAFFWNDKFVFTGNENDIKSKLKRLGKTYVSYGGTSLLSTFLLWLEVSVLGIGKVIAPIINLIITVPLNFLINKFWTFRKSKSVGEKK